MSQIIIKLDGEFQGRKIALENAPALELKAAIECLLELLKDENQTPTLALQDGCLEVHAPIRDSTDIKKRVAEAKTGLSPDKMLCKLIKALMVDELGGPSRSIILENDEGKQEVLVRSGETPRLVVNPADRAWEITFGYLKGRLTQIGDNYQHQNLVILEIPGDKRPKRIPVKGERQKLAELNKLYPIDSPSVELFVQYSHNFITKEDKDYQFIRVAGEKIDPSLIHAAIAKESLAWQGIDTEEWYKEVR